MRSTLALILVLLLASACASIGYYKAAGAKGTPDGYSEAKLSTTTYHVRYVGKANQKEIIHSLFLRRAAELTIQEGYKYFVIHDNDDASQRGLSSAPPDLPVYEANIEMLNKKVKGAYDAQSTWKQAVPQNAEKR